MFREIKATVLAAFVSLSALTALSAPADADTTVYFGIGGGQRPGAEFFIDRDYQPTHWQPRRYRQVEQRARNCTADRAARKAERMGLRRVYVIGENRNRIRVEGIDYGNLVRVVFARAPGCPVIRVRG